MTPILPFVPDLQFDSRQAFDLNAVVGHYQFPQEASAPYPFRSMSIHWSPGTRPIGDPVELNIGEHALGIYIQDASAFPPVRELLDGIPWQLLDASLQLTTLEVAFEKTLTLAQAKGVGPIAFRNARSFECDWYFDAKLYTNSGESFPLCMAMSTSAACWLGQQLARLPKISSRAFKSLPMTADLVFGCTELDLDQIRELSVGDQILFDPPGNLASDQLDQCVIVAENNARPLATAKLIDGQLSVLGEHACEEKLISIVPGTPGGVPLQIVGGSVVSTFDQFTRLSSKSNLTARLYQERNCLLKYRSMVIATGSWRRFGQRRAFSISAVARSQ